MSIFLKLIYELNEIPIKMIEALIFFFFARIWQGDFKIYVNMQMSKNKQNNFVKREPNQKI